ncbi:hypothetical protein H8959_012011 [Pygathrix nigripes]
MTSTSTVHPGVDRRWWLLASPRCLLSPAMNRRPGEPGHRDRRRLSRKSVRTPLPPPQVWIRRSPQ